MELAPLDYIEKIQDRRYLQKEAYFCDWDSVFAFSSSFPSLWYTISHTLDNFWIWHLEGHLKVKMRSKVKQMVQFGYFSSHRSIKKTSSTFDNFERWPTFDTYPSLTLKVKSRSFRQRNDETTTLYVHINRIGYRLPTPRDRGHTCPPPYDLRTQMSDMPILYVY